MTVPGRGRPTGPAAPTSRACTTCCGPASVAVIGAGRRRGSVGREILHNIVAGGFAGPVYPVNPRGRSMEGLACLRSAADLPEGVDLAVIAVPPAAGAAVAAHAAAAACAR